jgi:hypoxanthine phosphoribosyltransferase
MLKDDVAHILISEQDIQSRIAELGEQISNDYAGKTPFLIAVLKGAYIFLADLCRYLTIPHEVHFMAIASYGGRATQSSGVVRILMDLAESPEGRDVLVVEDIIDSGRTLDYILRNLRTRDPTSIRICSLLSKPSRREIDVPVDYVGFEIPDEFVIGYGLDFDEFYRNLPFIGVLKPELYSSNK